MLIYTYLLYYYTRQVGIGISYSSQCINAMNVKLGIGCVLYRLLPVILGFHGTACVAY